MIANKIFPVFLFSCLLAGPMVLFSQVLPTTKTFVPEDTVRSIEILPGVRKLEYRKTDSVTEVQILAGNVRLRQGTSLFECDSCVITKRLNLFEAFGNVHINDSDTTDIYADHLRYLTDKRIAYLDKNVKLTDGKGTLTTPALEYDVNTKVGIYKNGGRVVNKTTTLTSVEGYYYTDLKDVYFKKNVRLKDPAYTLESDSLLYNTETETARFIAETFIKDSTNRTIKTREGYYNLKSGKAEFGQRPVVQDGNIQATGDKMISDDSTGVTQIFGHAILVDTAENRTVLADEIFFNSKNESFLATKKPLMIIKQENDSIFVTADTLFSARLSDLYKSKELIEKKDTIKAVQLTDSKNKDSTNRIIKTNPLLSPGKIRELYNGKDSIVTNGMLERVKNLETKNKDSTNLNSETTDTLISVKPFDLNKDKDSSLRKEPLTGINIVDTKNRDTTDLPVANKRFLPIQSELRKSQDSTVKKDTLRGVTVIDMNTKDSTNRYFEAFRNVRIFTDSLQAVCDSMFYSFKDSVFRLYDSPIIWTKDNQITGDTILLFTKNKKADRMQIFKNSFIVNYVKPEIYNQVKSTRMDAYFKNGDIDSVRAKGNAESVYFIMDEDSSFSGVNQSSAELMDVYFINKELQRVVYRSKVKGTLWPIQQKSPGEMRLKDFKWLDDRRPKTKYELFQ